MGIVQDKIDALKEREEKIFQMGGEKAVASQKEKGKLTARERLNCLFDKGTFREIDMFVQTMFRGAKLRTEFKQKEALGS